MAIKLDIAFKNVPRINFLPDSVRYSANYDAPVPIGFGQTNSQPSLVYDMLEWLEVEPKDKVLDVGSGSGWTTALIAQLVGKNTKVYAVEIIPELVKFARSNCKLMGINNVEFYLATKQHGLPKFAPYNKILVSAAASSLPQDLIDQLAAGGIMVIPVNNDIYIIQKDKNNRIDYTVKHGFSFVPLVKP